MQVKAACRQKESLQTSKSEVGECSEHNKSAHRSIVFFIRWACPTYGYINDRADKPVIAHLFIGSASYASGSVITVTCKLLTFIRFSCLHLGQNKGKFFNIVSFLILSRVLLPQTGHRIHSAVFASIHYLLQISVHSCLFFCSWHIQRACQLQGKR